MSTITTPNATETQLLQLDKIMQLAGEAGEVARIEIAEPPPPSARASQGPGAASPAFSRVWERPS